MSIATLIESAANSLYPSNSGCSWTQLDEETYFIIDPSISSCDPAMISYTGVESFTIGGNWVEDETLDNIQVSCAVYGANIVNGQISYKSEVKGTWTTDIEVDIPALIEGAQYIFTFTGYSLAEKLFQVQTTLIGE